MHRREATCHCGQLRVTAEGEPVRISDEGEGRTFHFCPDCGSTVFYEVESLPGFIAIPVGAFADPAFPAPTVSVYGSRRHEWLPLPVTIEQEVH